MNFTRQQLESMTDLELNFAAAVLVYNKESVSISNGSVLIYQGFNDGARHYNGIDYCESWGDCGDLIDELIIEKQSLISFDKSNLIFTSSGDAFHMKHENIKRAVTIVYILIKQQ